MRLYVHLFYLASLFASVCVGVPLSGLGPPSNDLAADWGADAAQQPRDSPSDPTERPFGSTSARSGRSTATSSSNDASAWRCPNILNYGTKRMLQKRTIGHFRLDKRRIGLQMPNVLYLRGMNKRPNLAADER
ncbi:hypothetical protein M3Y99_00027700 [Aphelenchoides fujianensis]|nr:hypothetical protein M3Y99_00027700 [Aphelenchoides fujianensis]